MTPPPPSNSRDAATVAGYELIEELGRGAMGIVYKARQKGLNRYVALKMLLSGTHASASMLGRFRSEAEAVGRLRHPNIVHVYDVGEHEGRPFMSLEYVDGGTLAQRLIREAYRPREAARVVETLARAVHAAHEVGIIHRDLKPSNVLLTRHGEPKVADFGLVKLLGSDVNNTASGVILGTPAYTAPEQATGHNREVGPSTDVYALGAILYEMLGGRPPYKADSAMGTLILVVSENPPPPLPKEVPHQLVAICMKCLEKKATRRYQTAAALADDLAKFLNGQPSKAAAKAVSARRTQSQEEGPSWLRRNTVAIGALVAVAIGAGVGIWHMSRLSESLVQTTALEGAKHQAEMLDTINAFYSDVIVKRVKASGDGMDTPAVEVRHDYQSHANAIPIPATLTIDLGDAISKQSQSGVKVRLYSDYPFKARTDGGPHDGFEWEALVRLRKDPDQPYYSFENYQGRPVLRYATARKMTKESCVQCHNTHPESPKKDWKLGDVRGVLEIIRPLDQDNARAQASLSTSMATVIGVATTALIVCVGLLFVTDGRSRSKDEEAA
jgi:tRNA A-37 threonylcarbamoyl transferase component Bud32